MNAASDRRLLVALNGSPARGGSVDRLLEAACRGAESAGGRAEHVRCNELTVMPCQACGPEPTTGFCVFHDDMDRVYALLRDAHAVVVGSPVYFDTVSAQLKLVMDRCNCITPLVAVRRAAGAGETKDPGAVAGVDADWTFRPLWSRTRRAGFVVACGERHRWDLAERSVRGFLKWVGAKWEETIVWAHADNDPGSVTRAPELLERAEALGRRLIESPPLEP
jgi:NAD(P)H-dependent FMN reductase